MALSCVFSCSTLFHIIDATRVVDSYAKRVCDGFAALGSRGVSLLFASGDTGVGPDGPDAYQCVLNDGKNTSSFIAQFPSTCP
jgi:tripeptidyl-peptidase-1